MSFDRVLEPLSRSEFLARYWGREFVHVRGDADRFLGLFSWQDLNTILARRPFEHELFRLYQGGREIERSRYTQATSRGVRLLAGPITNLLAGGATLIADSVHVHSIALTELAADFESVLGAETLINVYACWREQAGFNLHWDWQEAMVLQVSGRKRWQVFRPTFDHPLADDRKKVPQPAGEPAWEGVLEQGDVLYLPRGWWHQAFPLNEPSLHLTITMLPPTASDFMSWLAQRVKEVPEGRVNAPLVGATEDASEFVRALRERILEHLEPASLEDFLAQWSSGLSTGRGFNLPEDGGTHEGPLSGGSNVWLATLPHLTVVKRGQAAWFYANGLRWDCPAGTAAAFEALSSATPMQVNALLGPDADAAVRRHLNTLLGALQMAGVVKTSP